MQNSIIVQGTTLLLESPQRKPTGTKPEFAPPMEKSLKKPPPTAVLCYPSAALLSGFQGLPLI
eukprot:14280049-Alexandrium_andersonii.AAC.1